MNIQEKFYFYKLIHAKNNFLICKNNYKKYHFYKEYQKSNFYLMCLNRYSLKINSIIQKYFFTNSKIRLEIKEFFKIHK